LSKMSKATDYVMDCEVSDWMDTECTLTCGGGEMTRTRTVLAKPANWGMQCPPLSEKEACNEQGCPVDCVLHEWEHWSACSAECGGGLRERTRTIRQEPANEGHACESLIESESCNSQNCNEDCELSDWDPWEPCTKGCGVGSQRRVKTVKTQALGEGTCAEPTDPSRQEFQLCNFFSCAAYLEPKAKVLKCDSLVDVIFLLDGSATVGEKGFNDMKAMVTEFAKQSTSKVKVAVLVFGGPTSLQDWQACTGDALNVDVAKVCDMNWITHLNSVDVNFEEVMKNAKYPDTTTLLDMAIGEADQELINGNPDSISVTVVVSDGKSMVEEATKQAAKRLQDKSRVIFMPLGTNPPLDFLNDVVSMPKRDHILKVANTDQLTSATEMNNLIAAVCPVLR